MDMWLPPQMTLPVAHCVTPRQMVGCPSAHISSISDECNAYTTLRRLMWRKCKVHLMQPHLIRWPHHTETANHRRERERDRGRHCPFNGTVRRRIYIVKGEFNCFKLRLFCGAAEVHHHNRNNNLAGSKWFGQHQTRTDRGYERLHFG